MFTRATLFARRRGTRGRAAARTYKWGGAALSCVVLAAAGCVDVDPQSVASGDLSADSPDLAEGAFYYDGNQRILLEPDPTELTVASAESPRVLADGVLRRADLRIEQVRELPQAPGHLLLRVSDDGVRGSVRGAVQRLRDEPAIEFAAPVYRVKDTGERIVLLNRVAVRMKDGWTPADLASLNAQFNTRVVRGPVPAEPDVVWLAYRRGGDPLELAAGLHDHPLVEWADPDKVQEWHLAAVPTDPFWADQYYARNNTFFNGVRVDINAQWAWDLTYGAWSAAAGPLVLAVVDSGVEVYHPDLNSGGSWGYDAFTGAFDAWGCTSCATNPGGDFSHGTAVAGIVRAEHNNDMGLAGIAPAVRLMSIRIATSAGVFASDSQIAQAINTAWYNGAHVMNNSWSGSGSSTAITSAIGRAVTEGRSGLGTVMVFAAGNTSARSIGIIGAVAFPASLSNVLAVSAINRNGGVADYSPNGSAIDVVAPSGHTTNACVGDVITVDLQGTPGCNDGPGGSLDYSSTFSGTSAAAPQAAAVAAMVMSRNPTWTEAQIRDRIKATADPWGSATTFGSGKLNAYRSLVGRVSVSISGPGRILSPGTYTWTANPTGGAGSYTYLWQLQNSGSSSWYTVGTSRSYSGYADEDADFTLRVTVSDGPDAHTVSRDKNVLGAAACILMCP